MSGEYQAPLPVNEPVRAYAPGSPERASIKARLTEMASEEIEIPLEEETESAGAISSGEGGR